MLKTGGGAAGFLAEVFLKVLVASCKGGDRRNGWETVAVEIPGRDSGTNQWRDLKCCFPHGDAAVGHSG